MTDRTLDLTNALQEAQLQRLEHLCQPDLPPHPLERTKLSKANRALQTVNWLFINLNLKEC